MKKGRAQKLPKSLPTLLIGTALGAGLVPYGPGTAGSLVGWGLGAALASQAMWIYWAVAAALLAVGTWASREWIAETGERDPKPVVIDEVVGMMIAGATAGDSPAKWAVAFVAFRVFDIWKPWPIRWLDRWSKKHTGWVGGFGVMADDVLAGVVALGVAWLVFR